MKFFNWGVVVIALFALARNQDEKEEAVEEKITEELEVDEMIYHRPVQQELFVH